MKTHNHLHRLLALTVLSSALLLCSCRKKEETPTPEPAPVQTDTEQNSINDNNNAENYAADIESIGSEVSENGALVSYKGAGESGEQGITAAPCATVSGLGTGTVTVDFGSGCVGNDGRTRSGKLIYTFAASSSSVPLFYRNPGFSMSVSSLNYVVDQHTVNIIGKNVSNTTPATIPPGLNPGTNLSWAITASLSIVKPNNGGTISWNCNRTKVLLNTSDTTCYKGQNKKIEWSRAIVQLNGTANGVNAQNENYTVVATNLVRDYTCSFPLQPKRHPFVGGTILYTPGTRFPRLINYGTGNCDLNATLTINGNTWNIVLN